MQRRKRKPISKSQNQNQPLQRFRPRTTLGSKQREERFGFRSKTRLQTRGYVELKMDILLNNQVYTEYGYSKTGIVSNDWETMFDDARYNAFMKVLYRDGYSDLNEANYEVEIENKIDGWDIKTYTFIYPDNNYRKLGNEDYYGKKRVVARKNDGSIKYYKDVENKDSVVKEYYDEFEIKDGD